MRRNFIFLLMLCDMQLPAALEAPEEEIFFPTCNWLAQLQRTPRLCLAVTFADYMVS